MERKLLVIDGPTASGKTSLSVAVAEKIGGEIISADSMQIYKGLDVGTSKVTESETKGIKHHMIDIVEPSVNYSVSDYVDSATKIIDELLNKGVQPIVVGGTGFYIDALLYKKSLGSVGFDENVREKYYAFAKEHGNEALYRKLCEIDPISAAKLSPNDIKRVVRALEIFETTGVCKSQQNDVEKRYDYKMYCIDMPREELYSRIEARVDEMVKLGLFDEVKGLLEHLKQNSTALSAIGYKEIVEYFNGNVSKDEAIAKIKLNTRHYAKRQLTYFRHQFDCVYVSSELSVEEKRDYVLNDFYSKKKDVLRINTTN